MNAEELIESYVADVARRLPRRQRNDVAFELRALLREELAARAADTGRPADAALALELVKDFGGPEQVAARYRTPLTIIDPADGHAFLRAAVIGLAVIWVLGRAATVRQSAGPGGDLLSMLGRWWVGYVIPSLWWPGVLVIWFGLAAWERRRRPQGAEWKPRTDTSSRGSRAGAALGIVGILCGAGVLVDPRWLLDVFLAGRAAPEAYASLTYTETFRDRQGPILLGLILLNIPLLAASIIRGRKSRFLELADTALLLAHGTAMAWAVAGEPILQTEAADRTAKALLVLIIAYLLISLATRLYRSVRPAPARSIQA